MKDNHVNILTHKPTTHFITSNDPKNFSTGGDFIWAA
jgi:hypothetical protein